MFQDQRGWISDPAFHLKTYIYSLTMKLAGYRWNVSIINEAAHLTLSPPKVMHLQ